MKCYLCKKEGNIEYQKRPICSSCFSRIIEKRIRKNARINKLFNKNDRILVLGKINKYFVESMLKDLPVKLFFRAKEDKEFIKKNRINKVVALWTLDDEANKFIKGVFSAKKVKANKKIKLLVNVSDKELEMFSKSNKIKFNPNKKDKDVQKFLDNVEKKHPNIKFNLLRNINELNKL